MRPIDLSEAIPLLADAMAGADPAAAVQATRALEKLAHNAARPGAPDERGQALAELKKLAISRRPRKVRAHALRLLGFVGDRGTERALAALERDPEVGEDARMARQRIRAVAY